MSKIEYDYVAVDNVLAQLNNSIKMLDSTESELRSITNEILNAKGIEYISNLDFSDIIESPKKCQDYISEAKGKIEQARSRIDEYNSEIDDSNIFTRVLSTVVNVPLKIYEGVGSGVESIVDGAASLTGLAVGIFSDDAKDAIGGFVKKNWVGDFFDDQYKDGILSPISQYSYMSSTGIASTIFSGIGSAVPYIGLTVATGGMGTGAAVAGAGATGASTAAATASMVGVSALGGLGTGQEIGLQKGKSFNDAFFSDGMKNAAIQGATVYVTNGIANAVSKSGSKIISKFAGKYKNSFRAAAGSTDDVVNAASKDVLQIEEKEFSNASSKAASTAGKVDVTDDAIKSYNKQLDNLQKLRKEGKISPSEYKAQKKDILSKIKNVHPDNVNTVQKNITEGAKNKNIKATTEGTTKQTTNTVKAANKVDDVTNSKIKTSEKVLGIEGPTEGTAKTTAIASNADDVAKLTGPVKNMGSKVKGIKGPVKASIKNIETKAGNSPKIKGPTIGETIGLPGPIAASSKIVLPGVIVPKQTSNTSNEFVPTNSEKILKGKNITPALVNNKQKKKDTDTKINDNKNSDSNSKKTSDINNSSSNNSNNTVSKKIVTNNSNKNQSSNPTQSSKTKKTTIDVPKDDSVKENSNNNNNNNNNNTATPQTNPIESKNETTSNTVSEKQVVTVEKTKSSPSITPETLTNSVVYEAIPNTSINSNNDGSYLKSVITGAVTGVAGAATVGNIIDNKKEDKEKDKK